jgi:hypothetical protein
MNRLVGYAFRINAQVFTIWFTPLSSEYIAQLFALWKVLEAVYDSYQGGFYCVLIPWVQFKDYYHPFSLTHSY